MLKFVDTVKKAIKNKDTKTLFVNVICSFGVKGLSLLIGLFTTPTYIRYFNDNEILGVWFTILSVLSWILHCDMGIGNGLRNKLVKALQSKNKDEGRKYVSSAYMFLFSVSLIIVAVITGLSQFVNWNSVFNIDTSILNADILRKTLTILLVSIILQFVLRLITSILYALQKAFIPSLLNLLTNIMMLVYASIAIRMRFNGSIVTMAIVYLIAVNAPLVITTIVVFCFTTKGIRPALKYVKKEYAMSTLKIGGAFLWIQLMAMILNSTNSYFVTLFVGNSATVEFNIYNKIFTLIGTFVTLATTPIWSAVTKAQVEKNFKWMSNLFKKFIFIALLAICAEFILIIPLQYVFDIWLGVDSIPVNYRIAIIFALYGSVMIWSSSITCFANGLGELKLQSIFLTLGAVIDVVLTYILARITNSYVAIVVANICAFIPYLFVQTIWLMKYMKNAIRLNKA